jgi:hypothetical protein
MGLVSAVLRSAKSSDRRLNAMNSVQRIHRVERIQTDDRTFAESFLYCVLRGSLIARYQSSIHDKDRKGQPLAEKVLKGRLRRAHSQAQTRVGKRKRRRCCPHSCGLGELFRFQHRLFRHDRPSLRLADIEFLDDQQPKFLFVGMPAANQQFVIAELRCFPR